METVGFESGVGTGMSLEPSTDALLLHQLLGGTSQNLAVISLRSIHLPVRR